MKKITSGSFILCAVILCLSIISCDKKSEKPSPNELKVNEVDTTTTIEEEKPKRLIFSFKLDSLPTQVALDSFNVKYNKDEKNIIYALNRIDAYRVQVGTSIIIPDSLSLNLIDYSPFPTEFPILDSIPKVVLIAQRIQAFGIYENGKLLRWGPVSSGKQSTPTPNGLNYGNYKAKRKISTVNDAWIMPYYFNFMNFEGVGTHEYTLPGFPASHACVRLYLEDATFIYDWATMWELDKKGNTVVKNGTPFMVFGDYNFNEDVPWLKLENNMEANDLNSEEIEILKGFVENYKNDQRNYVEEEESIEAIL